MNSPMNKAVAEHIQSTPMSAVADSEPKLPRGAHVPDCRARANFARNTSWPSKPYAMP
jgi:hypothetical protein